MVSPFAMHQQQLAMLAQQQQLLMAAAAKSAGGDPKVMNQQQLAMLTQQQQLMAAAAKSVGGDLKLSGSIQQGPNGISIPAQNWPNMGYQIPGLMMPVAGQGDLQKLMQVHIMELQVAFIFTDT
jgi:stromal membrane-associated protein